MNSKRIYINSEEEFLSNIQGTIRSEENCLNILCAGHFLLMPDKEKTHLIPAIFNTGYEDEYYAFAKQMVGIFPQYTFDLAAKTINANRNTKAKSIVSLLVNDWQLVPEDRHRKDLSEPNKYRTSFYEGFKELPQEYKEILQENTLTQEKEIYKTPAGDFFLKEVSLRDRFMRKAKALFKKTESDYVSLGMCSLELDDCGNIQMINEDDLTQQLSDNSRAGCAAGVAQMMIDIFYQYKGSFDNINFINFMPWGCINPVNAASELALNFISEDSGNGKVSISNYFLDGTNTLTPEDFYSLNNKRVVTGYTFNQ